MRVEIDQSGKLEHLDTDTVVSYSNGKSEAVRISTVVKRSLTKYLKQSLILPNLIKPTVFAICVFLLIENLPSGTVLEIDEEYTGKDLVITSILEKLLQRRWKNKWRGEIRFRRIGKSSPAHELAWTAHRFPRKYPLRKLNLKEVLKFFELKKPG